MAKKAKPASDEETVCRNPKAQRGFDIEERFEAGLVLVGSEVKSLRACKADLDGAYASVDRGEAMLHKMHIAMYENASTYGHEIKRSRRLLLKIPEIRRIQGRLATRGYTLVPLRVYFKKGWAKVEVGLGTARNVGDKRQALRKDADMREAREAASRRR